jgi:hypothetical protein
MSSDDSLRGMNNHQNRKAYPPKFNEKPSYSPSSSFNYNGNYNSGNSSGYNNQQSQGVRRRPENRFGKTGGGGHHSNSNDRLVKQNDIIIRLLKEIRDRLPEPLNGATVSSDSDYDEQDHINQSASDHAGEQDSMDEHGEMDGEGTDDNEMTADAVDSNDGTPGQEPDSDDVEER